MLVHADCNDGPKEFGETTTVAEARARGEGVPGGGGSGDIGALAIASPCRLGKDGPKEFGETASVAEACERGEGDQDDATGTDEE